ncbi:MAG: cytolethal distending toxin family protein [Deltaproteobacteria bacterium]|nr:cytolethal distending toxin family protein [Deltaproteobacteria bacterium]
MISVNLAIVTLVGIIGFGLRFGAPTPVAAVESGICKQWQVPPSFIAGPGGAGSGQQVTFRLKQDGSKLVGKAFYKTTKKIVIGNVSGSLTGNTFSVRALWTYSGVSSIGRYTGVITPREGGTVGDTMYGFIFQGRTYDEYVSPPKFEFWNAYHFTCQLLPPQYIGKFDAKVPNVVLMQKRALYAENIDEPLVAPAGAAIDVQLTFQQCHKLVSSPGCPVTPSFEQWGYDPGSHRLVHAASGKCVNISGARRDPGAPIILYPCSGAANEKWTVIAPAGKLTWTVKSDLNGMCLHAIPGRRSSGPNQRVGNMTIATLVQMPCDGSAAQRFSSVDSNWGARNGPR